MQITPRLHNHSPISSSSLEVVGKASWLVEESDSAERKRSVDIHTQHLDIADISQLEAELTIQGQKWESLFQAPVCEISRGLSDYVNESGFPAQLESPIDT